MANDSSSRAPYAPARALLVSIVSIVISAPTLLIGLLLVISGTYLALFGHSLYASTPLVVQVPVPVCLFLVLGPMLALVHDVQRPCWRELLYMAGGERKRAGSRWSEGWRPARVGRRRGYVSGIVSGWRYGRRRRRERLPAG